MYNFFVTSLPEDIQTQHL